MYVQPDKYVNATIVKPQLPKHALIAQALEQDLAQGKYGVGATLPSEPELTHLFGVSRHTVRAALRTLQERGLITSQQGLGSIVRATQVAPQSYMQGFASAEDLLQYVADSRPLSMERRELLADEPLAAWLGCRAGERWWHVKVLRSRRDDAAPHTLADVYLPYAYGRLLNQLGASDKPIFRSIEEQFGETITEIRQEISAAMPTEAERAALQLGEHEPVLAIVRRYFGRHGQVLETTRTLHRGSNFTYAMQVRPASGRATG